MDSNSDTLLSRCEYFVKEVIDEIIPANDRKPDTAFRAEMVRADNPQKEYHAYKHLVRLKVNLENNDERRAFALIGAAIARHRIGKPGGQNFGKAMRIASTMDNGEISPAGYGRMKRILACKNSSELINILRHVLRFILQKESVDLNLSQLLKDILIWGYSCKKQSNAIQYIKIRWAKDFYGNDSNEKKSQNEKEET